MVGQNRLWAQGPGWEDPAVEDGGVFTEELWEAASPVYQAILEHPFLAGLRAGTLPPDRFRFFLEQDRLFLDSYARSLTLMAARAPSAEAILLFSRDCAGAIEAERELEEQLLAAIGEPAPPIAQDAPAPTTMAYGNYLLGSCWVGSFAEALGAVLPCYWVYFEVGRDLSRSGSPSPIYQRWIDNYASPEFGAVVTRVRALMDIEGTHLSQDQRDSVTRHFVAAGRYEWMFWQMAWQLESWPI
jgi:thiaminase/transcriptional activator TenA